MPTAIATAPTPTLRRTRPVGAKEGWNWKTAGPGKCLMELSQRVPSWLQHAWRYVDQNGDQVWVAEPYELGPGAYEDFIFLKNSGYDVQVSAEAACHCPGSTVAVVITAR